ALRRNARVATRDSVVSGSPSQISRIFIFPVLYIHFFAVPHTRESHSAVLLRCPSCSIVERETLFQLSLSLSNMAEEPMPTRWSFQDFKLYYDAKFGRKKALKNGETDDKVVSNGDSLGFASNGNLHAKRASDMAVYEQFQSEGQNQTHTNGFSPVNMDGRPQKSLLPPFESAEMRTLAESLSRDIIRGSPDVKWESIKGLENAKRLLKEAVVMPIKYPKYFTGLLSPWKGILLFGPPGTGKTMLAKAVATECKTTFFNISASSVLVKVLFELARHHAPSTIFLDEIDAIISQRGEARSEHEASRRLKTELLIQMDGLTRTDELVFVLAATNLPWELDAAMLRRLEKRILVPLPEPEARRGMFEELLPPQPDEEPIPYDLLVEQTEGFSGSDIRLLCKETAMQPLRRLMSQLEQTQEVLPEEELPKVGPIRSEDIETALKNTRPSAHLHAHKYDKFNADYGSQILH
ncbi:Katanin p60 ATPase-containing subunit A-like 2, partial [Mucuna pruriens]